MLRTPLLDIQCKKQKKQKKNYIPIPKCGVPNIQLLIKIKEKNAPRERIYLRIFFTLKKCRKKIGLRWYHQGGIYKGRDLNLQREKLCRCSNECPSVFTGKHIPLGKRHIYYEYQLSYKILDAFSILGTPLLDIQCKKQIYIYIYIYIPIPKRGIPNIQLLIKIKEKNAPRERIYLRVFFTLKKTQEKDQFEMVLDLEAVPLGWALQMQGLESAKKEKLCRSSNECPWIFTGKHIPLRKRHICYEYMYQFQESYLYPNSI